MATYRCFMVLIIRGNSRMVGDTIIVDETELQELMFIWIIILPVKHIYLTLMLRITFSCPETFLLHCRTKK